MPQTQLWEMATYEMKPRLNRLNGVSTVIVQGGQEPEFQITPDPAKLLTAGATVSDILDAVRRTNLIDSPGLLEQNHQLFLGLVNGQVHNPERNRRHRHQDHASRHPGAHRRRGDRRTRVKPVYTIVTANGQPAVLLNINRQPDSNTVRWPTRSTARSSSIRKSLPPGIELQPFYDQSEIVSESITQRARRHPDRADSGLHHPGALPARLGHFDRRRAGDSRSRCWSPSSLLKVLGESFNLMTLGGLAAAVGLVIDDAIVVVENIVLHRDAGEGRLEAIRSALKEITVPLIGSTITPVVVFLPLDLDHRRDRHVLPRPGGHHGRVAVDLAGPGAGLDAQPEPLLHS